MIDLFRTRLLDNGSGALGLGPMATYSNLIYMMELVDAHDLSTLLMSGLAIGEVSIKSWCITELLTTGYVQVMMVRSRRLGVAQAVF